MVNIKNQTTKTTRNELMYIMANTLLYELAQRCKRSVVEYVLRPMIKKRLGTRFRLGNLVVLVEAPGDGLNAGELHQYMRELASMAPWLDVVYGIITNGAEAEYYVLKRGEEPELKARGGFREVAAAAAADLCAGKIPIVSPEDIAVIFGV